jgi:hypothetical protein
VLDRAREAFALDEHDALRRQRLGDALVLRGEVPLGAIDHLQHADQRIVLDQRHGQETADVVVVVEVDLRVEAGIGTAVRHVDDGPRARGEAEDAAIGRGPHGLPGRGAGQDQLAGRRIVQPQRGALGVQHAARGLADLCEHLGELEGCRQPAGDFEDLQQRLRAEAGRVRAFVHAP